MPKWVKNEKDERRKIVAECRACGWKWVPAPLLWRRLFINRTRIL